MSDVNVANQPSTTPPPPSKPLGFLQDSTGNFSSTRLAFLVWAIGVLACWAYVVVKSLALPPIPTEVVTVLGILMTGKVVQKYTEQQQ